MKLGHQEFIAVAILEDEATASKCPPTDPVRACMIEASHQRCRQMQLSTLRSLDFGRLSRIELTRLRNSNKRLLTHATPVAEMLVEFARLNRSVIVLTDAKGTVLHCCGNEDFLAKVARLPLRPGINWSEPSRGTNAIGTCLVAEQLITVHGDEHYVQSYDFLTGSSTPLHDPRGDISGAIAVLGAKDSSSAQALSLLRFSAKMIQNRWLTSESSRMLRIHFHRQPDWIDTLAEGIISADNSGHIRGCNQAAEEILATSAVSLRRLSINDLFGQGTEALLSHFSSSEASALRVRSKDDQQYYIVARFFESEWRHQSSRRNAPSSRPGGPTDEARNLTRSQLDTDPVVHKLLEDVGKLYAKGVSILVCGETGTGKEEFAKAIHQNSSRSKQPFIAINCASIPESSIESELFGYEKGAYTGARKGVAGKVVQAQGGTLFLDEIGDMPLALQGRLLRVIQEREVTPIGGSVPVPVDVAVISATHRRLSELISLGTFRQDLYYRLNGFVAKLPPLRERKDIPQLVNSILTKESKGNTPHVDPELLRLILEHPWPGNIRQLHNALKIALALSDGRRTIGLDCLPSELLFAEPADQVGDSSHLVDNALRERFRALSVHDAQQLICVTRSKVEDDAIRNALASSNGNISAAARELGICRNTIYRRFYWID